MKAYLLKGTITEFALLDEIIRLRKQSESRASIIWLAVQRLGHKTTGAETLAHQSKETRRWLNRRHHNRHLAAV
jgi:hypothetical protein